MTESNVLYTQAANPNAGAVPQLTNVATHERASDGASVQDVFIDPVNTVTITREDNLFNDAFQRQRVSDTDQRFDGDFSYDLSPLLFDNISATVTPIVVKEDDDDLFLAAWYLFMTNWYKK